MSTLTETHLRGSANKASTGLLKRATNISINRELLDTAKELKINVSKFVETALAAHVQKLKEEQWRRENAAAIAGYNAWYDNMQANGDDVLALVRHEVWLGEAVPAASAES